MEPSRLGYGSFLREAHQGGVAGTADVRFQAPTYTCGNLCLWLEHKNYFGFNSNPLETIQEVCNSDRSRWSVLYRLRFESGHVNIDGVIRFREKEAVEDLKIRVGS